MSIAQNGASDPDERCETRIGASPLDIAVTVLLSPLIILWFAATWIAHGLGRR